MNKKTIFIFVALVSFSFLVSCNLVKKPRPWNKALDENKIDLLLKPVAEIKKNFEAAQQFQTKGQRAKANEQYKRMQEGINNLENIYIPLLNAKAYLATASRLAERKEFTKSHDEFINFMTQISTVKSKSSSAMAKDINRILINAENLAADLAGQKANLFDQFSAIAVQMDALIINTIK